MANEIAEKSKTEVAERKKAGIASYLSSEAIRTNIESVVGKDIAQAFISDIVACVQNNTQLSACSNTSILSSALVAKSVNLPLTPQLGYAWLVPFDNKKQINGHTEYVKEASLQIGYKGYVQLATRSGYYKKIVATDVRKGEIKDYDPFNDSYVFEPCEFDKRMAKDSKGNYIVPIIGYYAKFVMNTGLEKELYMSAEDMLEYAKKYSKAYRSDIKNHTSYSFWTTKFEDMARKTMLRQLLGKWGLLTPDMQKAYTSDMAVMDENGNPIYLDNQPDEGEPVVNPFEEVSGEVIDSTATEIPNDIQKECDEVFK